MNDLIVLPAMDEAQAASWHAIMALHTKLPENWALVGGQLVHLHCAERGTYPTRPTTDVDAVVDIRADPLMLTRFTAALVDLGFTADTSGEGHQHLIGALVGKATARVDLDGGSHSLSALRRLRSPRRLVVIKGLVGSERHSRNLSYDVVILGMPTDTAVRPIAH